MNNFEGAAEIVKSGAFDKMTDLIHKLAGPLAEEVGLLMGEKVRAYRVTNIVRVFQKTRAKLSDAGLPENAVPPRVFLPILDASSLEADESLQDLWAGLLASASQKSDALSPSFIETLKQLTPNEARTLNACFELLEDVPSSYVWTENELQALISIDGDSTRFVLTINTFERLGLFTKVYNLQERSLLFPFNVSLPSEPYVAPAGVSWAEPVYWGLSSEVVPRNEELPELTYKLRFTQYGLEFIKACRGPSRVS